MGQPLGEFGFLGETDDEEVVEDRVDYVSCAWDDSLEDGRAGERASRRAGEKEVAEKFIADQWGMNERTTLVFSRLGATHDPKRPPDSQSTNTHPLV